MPQEILRAVLGEGAHRLVVITEEERSARVSSLRLESCVWEKLKPMRPKSIAAKKTLNMAAAPLAVKCNRSQWRTRRVAMINSALTASAAIRPIKKERRLKKGLAGALDDFFMGESGRI